MILLQILNLLPSLIELTRPQFRRYYRPIGVREMFVEFSSASGSDTSNGRVISALIAPAARSQSAAEIDQPSLYIHDFKNTCNCAAAVIEGRDFESGSNNKSARAAFIFSSLKAETIDHE